LCFPFGSVGSDAARFLFSHCKGRRCNLSSVFCPRFQHGYRRQHLAFHEFQEGAATG
jgi:hypothetical protein